MWGTILWSCHSSSSSALSIDMEKVKGDKKFNFNELASDSHLVRLETKPDVLLEGGFRIWAGVQAITMGFRQWMQSEENVFHSGTLEMTNSDNPVLLLRKLL